MRISLCLRALIFCLPTSVQAITPCWKAIQTMEGGEGFKECARLYEEDGDSLAAFYLHNFAWFRGDYKKATTWLKLAVIPTKQYPDGFKDAQHLMGKYVLYGRYGMEISHKIAYNLFDAAAKQGDPPCNVRMGTNARARAWLSPR